MKRSRRIWISLACLLAATVMLTGCGNKPNAEEDKGGVEMTEMVKQALTLNGADMDNFNEDSLKMSEKMLMESAACVEETLARKYPGVEFEMVACVPHSITQDQDMFTLQPAGRPEEEFTACVTGETELACTDSYYGVLRVADYEAHVKALLQSAEPDAQVFSTIDYQFEEKYDAETAIETAIAESGMNAFTWVLLAPGETAFEERAAAIENIMTENGLRGECTVYLMNDEAAVTKAEAFELIPSGAQQVYTEKVRFIVQ